MYAVGHRALGVNGRLMAAVLACGPGAVLSHRSAAAHLNVRPSARAKIDVTVRGRRGRGRDGIEVHDGASLHESEVAMVEGIPCTTVARTLLDLAGILSRRELERTMNRAEMLRLFDGRQVAAALERCGPRRGGAALRGLLGEDERLPALTRSELEERLFTICHAAGLPRPLVNLWVPLGGGAGYEADFAWPDQRVIVEVDGWGAHGTRHVFEADRSRDRRLLIAGWYVARFTWRQVMVDPVGVGEDLRRLLGAP